MSKLTSHRTFFFGLISPLAAAALGVLVYGALTRASSDRDADFVFRLSMTALAMTLPFFVTATFAWSDRKRGGFAGRARIGLALALVSLGLTWLPIRGLIARQRQAANLALEGIEAPPFDTVDLHGNRHRLGDHAGEVILVNIWATWCTPCRREMPELDRLYQSRREEGLMVFGLSVEEPEVQRAFAADVPVSYPLLTTEGEVPEIFTTTARYPANFLVDRKGRLRPAPSVEEPFEELEAAVGALLREEP